MFQWPSVPVPHATMNSASGSRPSRAIDSVRQTERRLLEAAGGRPVSISSRRVGDPPLPSGLGRWTEAKDAPVDAPPRWTPPPDPAKALRSRSRAKIDARSDREAAWAAVLMSRAEIALSCGASGHGYDECDVGVTQRWAQAGTWCHGITIGKSGSVLLHSSFLRR